MKISTTSNPDTWFINQVNYTQTEVRDYCESLTFESEELRSIIINTIDHAVAINGITFLGADLGPLEAYKKRNGNVVSFIRYYPDRDIVECQYSTHPLDPPVPNTRHEGSEFKSALKTVFDTWKTSVIEKQNEVIELQKLIPDPEQFA